MATTVKRDYACLDMQAMNTQITVYGESVGLLKQHDLRWRKQVFSWFRYVHKVCSRFDPQSSLSQFNQFQMGQRIILPSTLYAVLSEAWEWAKQTDFFFNPFVAESLERLGYKESFEKIANQVAMDTVESFKEKESCKTVCSLIDKEGLSFGVEELLFFYPKMKAIEKKKQYKVDLGGIAKGWSVDHAAELLKKRYQLASGFVNAGGDIQLWSAQNNYWRIGIAHPFNKEKEIAQVLIAQGGIATSNKHYRRWKSVSEDKWHHHLLHGHTLQPAESDVLQATVFAPSTTEAEVIAKVLCTLAVDEGEAWLKAKFPHLAYILVNDELEIIVSANIEQYVYDVTIRKEENLWSNYKAGYRSGN